MIPVKLDMDSLHAMAHNFAGFGSYAYRIPLHSVSQTLKNEYFQIPTIRQSCTKIRKENVSQILTHPIAFVYRINREESKRVVAFLKPM